MSDPGHRRTIRSYVLRGGRLTTAQQRALDELWPRYGIEAGTEELDFPALFGNENPVVMEIGFGNGEATWRMAANEPEHNFLAVEVHRPGVGHLLLKLEEYELANVRVACGDAVELLQRRIAGHSLGGVRIYFPDPWHKKRHHKRRLVQAAFVRQLARVLEPGGVLHLATDWTPYAEHMAEVLKDEPAFENTSKTPPYGPRPAWRPATKYEQRGQRLGHEVHDLVYRRTTSGLG